MTNDLDRPAEASLYDDPTTADLSAKVAEAWKEFGDALGDALSALPVDATLELTLDPTASGIGEAVYSVSVTPATGGLRAFAIGNSLLPPEHRLSRTAVGEMVALGWSPPGVVSGGDERFGLQLPTDQAQRLAAIVSRTLRDIYGTPHPAFLVYAAAVAPAASEVAEGGPAGSEVAEGGAAGSEAAEGGTPASDNAEGGTPASDNAEGGTAASEVAEGGTTAQPAAEPEAASPDGVRWVGLSSLGAARPAPESDERLRLPGQADLSSMALADKVATVIAAMLRTTPDNLPVDTDGDIGIRSGSAMVFVRVRDNPPLVDVFSPVLTGIDANERLYVKLSELTHRMPIGRLYCANDTVWASVPVFGREFQPTHLMLAVQVMTGLADELDDRLQGEFGGRRFFVETDTPSVETKDDDQTGMYL